MPRKLNTRLIDDEAAPSKGAKTLWDTDVKGFGVRIFAPTARCPSGARSFFVNYRVDGIERRFTIGQRPTWSVEAAREEAKALRRRIDRGEDPAVDRRERREAPTVKDLIDRYIAEHLPTKAAKGARDTDERKMLAEIGERLGLQRKVADVHFGDVTAMHRAITESGRPVRANRVLAIASKMFSLALKPCAGEDKPWRDAAMGNPCAGVRRNHESAKERFFSEAELAALSDALAEGRAGSSADCIRFIMLTGCRPGEAMQARWEEIDAEPGYWIKPSAHTKQRKVHKLPLSPAAIELIERLRGKRADGIRWIFPGQKPGEPLKQLWAVWYAARDRATVALWGSSIKEKVAKLVGDLRAVLGCEPTIDECKAAAAAMSIELPTAMQDARIYDLRHTFASVGAGGGLSLQIIGRLLGHTQARTTQRYAHLADDPLREAAAKIGSVIAGAGKAAAEVVPLTKRGPA